MSSKAYPIPLDGNQYPALLPWRGKGIRVVNSSNVPVLVTDDNGTPYFTPAGEVQSYNSALCIVPRYGVTAANGTGWATVTFYNREIDPSANAPTQQPPGLVTTTDTTTQQLLNALGTLLGITNTNTSNTAANAGNTNTGVANLVTLITATNALDTDIRTYINYVRGLLALTSTNFTLAAAQEFTYTLTAPLAGFTLQTAPGASGRLNIYVIGSGGAKDYLLKDQILYAGPSTLNPSPKIYRRNLLTGDVIHVAWDDSTASCGFAMRV